MSTDGRSADLDDQAASERTVRDRLRTVTDPELDRSIVDLGYIDALRIQGSSVRVQFTLPTAWCSPSFAWMMATDIRDEVSALSGVESVEVDLADHMQGEAITRGVNDHRSFTETFEDATDDVEALRARLDEKARLARQYRAVEALLESGLAPGQIVRLTPRDISFGESTARVPVRDGALVVSAPRDPIERYLDKARDTGVVTGPDDPLFATPDGQPIPSDKFTVVHRRARAAKANMTGQESICDRLNEARRARRAEPVE